MNIRRSPDHIITQTEAIKNLLLPSCWVPAAQGMSASDLKYSSTPSTSFTYSGSKPARSQKALHSLNTTSCHMHQYIHHHNFTPILHQSCFPMMGTQHSNLQLVQHGPRSAVRRPSFTPVTVFHRATQKSFKSAKRGRWGGMHVSIAWQIYYHKQLKKMQPKPNSPHQELSSSLPDSVQHQDPEQRSCIQPSLNSTCGQSAYGKRSEVGKTTEKRSHLTNSYPLSPSHLQTKEELGQTNWKVKTEETLDACWNVLPPKVKCRDHTAVSPEPEGRRDTVSRGRKRLLECDSSINMKRVKQEVEDDQFYPSLSATRTDVSSHATSVQHINTSDSSGLCCNSTGCNVVSYPGAEVYPYQTASWEHMWNQFKQMNRSLTQQLLGDYLQNGCKVIKISPRALRQRETPQLGWRNFMNRHHLHHCCHPATTTHLPHPGFLAASYTGL